MTSKEIKQLRDKLMNADKIRIGIKGLTKGYKNDDLKPLVLKNSKEIDISAVCEEGWLRSKQMNVRKFGPTCMWLFTYDLLNQQVNNKIKYEDIVLMEDEDEK